MPFSLGSIAFTILSSRWFWTIASFVLLVSSAYHWAYVNGKVAEQGRSGKVIVSLKAERDALQDQLDAILKTNENQVKAHDKAIRDLTESSKTVVKNLTKALDVSDKRAKKMKDQLDELIAQNLPATVDANFPVPVGLIRVHDLSVSGGPLSTSESILFSASRAEDVGATASLKISSVGRTIAENYAECHSREAVITAWQTWYRESLLHWQSAANTQSNYQLVTPSTLSRPAFPFSLGTR